VGPKIAQGLSASGQVDTTCDFCRVQNGLLLEGVRSRLETGAFTTRGRGGEEDENVTQSAEAGAAEDSHAEDFSNYCYSEQDATGISQTDISTRYQSRNKKNGVLWDVTPCGSCKNRRLGGT
jgi:hypothetical protein